MGSLSHEWGFDKPGRKGESRTSVEKLSHTVGLQMPAYSDTE